MRTHIAFLLLLAAQFALAQPYFARLYQFSDGLTNQIECIQSSGDSLLFRMNSNDADPATIETRMATMPLNSSQFNGDVYLPGVQAGNSMFKDGSFYLLPSEDRNSGKHITLNRLDENFSFVDSVHLNLAAGPYYYYVSKAFLYNDKYIVTGTAQNTTGYAFGRTVIFIVNKDFTLHDTIIIEPVRQSIVPRDFAVNPVDGRLYLSLVYDNFHPQDSTFTPAPKYQRVVSIDSTFQVSDFWDSEAYPDAHSNAAPIAFSQTGTLYSFYSQAGGFDKVVAVGPSGQEIWDTPLDSFMVVGPTILWLTSRYFVISDLAVASNGDILAAGYTEDTQYNIGRSSFLARLQPNGAIKWNRVYRSNNLFSVQNYGYASDFNQVLEIHGGNIVAGGGALVFDEFLSPNTAPITEAWLLRADSNGCISPACGYIQDAVQKLNYLPIVHPANEWTVAHSELLLNSRRKYRFSPDSVSIGGKYYHELTYDDSFLGFKTTGRYYREEDGVVYTAAGAVVYDLNIGATDTLPSNQGANQGTRMAMSAGTVIYGDGIPRKTLMVQCANDSLDMITVVEGIGDLEDFFHSEVLCINPLDGPSDLILCYSVGGEIVYKKPDESCELSSTTHPGKKNLIRVYPNPATGRLYIDMPVDGSSQGYQVQVFNTLGEPVIINPNLSTADGLLSVDISGLNPGSYWCLIRDEDGNTFPFAFIRANN
ncbi:MAG: T9SS type A sorting domain-containing protein [Saprospiraceae bacterium]